MSTQDYSLAEVFFDFDGTESKVLEVADDVMDKMREARELFAENIKLAESIRNKAGTTLDLLPPNTPRVEPDIVTSLINIGKDLDLNIHLISSINVRGAKILIDKLRDEVNTLEYSREAVKYIRSYFITTMMGLQNAKKAFEKMQKDLDKIVPDYEKMVQGSSSASSKLIIPAIKVTPSDPLENLAATSKSVVQTDAPMSKRDRRRRKRRTTKPTTKENPDELTEFERIE